MRACVLACFMCDPSYGFIMKCCERSCKRPKRTLLNMIPRHASHQIMFSIALSSRSVMANLSKTQHITIHTQSSKCLPLLQHWILRCFASIHLLVMHWAVITWLPGTPSLLHLPAMHGVMEALGVWHPQLVRNMLPVLLALVAVSPAWPTLDITQCNG